MHTPYKKRNSSVGEFLFLFSNSVINVGVLRRMYLYLFVGLVAVPVLTINLRTRKRINFYIKNERSQRIRCDLSFYTG